MKQADAVALQAVHRISVNVVYVRASSIAGKHCMLYLRGGNLFSWEAHFCIPEPEIISCVENA